MDPVNFYKATKHDDGAKSPVDNKTSSPHESAHAYAEINKEIESLLTEGDRIVFSPAEDFEYTKPLEDFRKSQKISAS